LKAGIDIDLNGSLPSGKNTNLLMGVERKLAIEPVSSTRSRDFSFAGLRIDRAGRPDVR
jgi:hypothetical protein